MTSTVPTPPFRPEGPVLKELREANQHLTEQVALLRERLERHQAELVRTRRELADAQESSRWHADRYLAVEEEKSNLAKLYVAASFLHGSLERAQVVEALNEVLINLLGSEDFAVYERGPLGEPQLVTAFSAGAGSPPPSVQTRRALATGELYLRPADRAEGVAACIPLRLQGEPAGVVEVRALLPQKQGFNAFDEELFELLGAHAAPALHATRLHALSLAGASA
jgi:hypothetical protein